MWQCFGFLTEYVSVPKAFKDNQVYARPVGAFEYQEYLNGKWNHMVDYYRNDRALKLISQNSWEVQNTFELYQTIAHTRVCAVRSARGRR